MDAVECGGIVREKFLSHQQAQHLLAKREEGVLAPFLQVGVNHPQREKVDRVLEREHSKLKEQSAVQSQDFGPGFAHSECTEC